MKHEVKTRSKILFAGLAVAIAGLASQGQVNAAVTVPTQAYVMAFHTCAAGATDCNNPANHIVQLAQSGDGLNWSLVGGWQSYRGSVPDAFRRGNTLYVFSTSGLLKVNMTTGETSTTSVSLNEGSFVDPSIAQLPDGRLILFYLPGIMGQDPAGCAPGEASCIRQIKSAVEVAGSDGSRFVVDSTPRVSETITSGSFSDPDIFFNGSEWVLYVSRGPSVHAYVSSSIQGTYTFRAIVSNNLGGVPSGLQMSDGTIATYVHFNVGGGTEIRRATSSTGAAAISSFQTSLTAQSLSLGTHAESPGVAANTAGISCASCVATAVTTTTSPTATAPASKTSNVGLGKPCTVAGATAKSGKTNLVCKKVGKRLVWAKR